MKKLKLELGSIKEMLSKEQMKKVLGGEDYGEYGGRCHDGLACMYEESPYQLVHGRCETNSLNRCVCNAGTSSVYLEWCKNA